MSDHRLDGPENVPLRDVVRSLLIVVSVFDLSKDNDDPIRVEHMDYGDYRDRQWLGRITAWALMQGFSVETCRKEDWSA